MRQRLIKFLELLLDEIANWKGHFKFAENKFMKNLRRLNRQAPS